MTPEERVSQLLNRLNTSDEHKTLEAKKASRVSDGIMETVNAFANTEGGVLLLGIARKDNDLWGPYQIVGLSHPDQIQLDFVTRCNTDFNHPIRPNVEVAQFAEGAVLIADIAPLKISDRPLHLKSEPLPHSARIRIGSSDIRCSESDIFEMAMAKEAKYFDTTPLNEASWDDFDRESIEFYKKVRREKHIDAEELNWVDHDFMRSLGCIEASGSNHTPTVAGIMMFGKRSSIRRLFPLIRIDYTTSPDEQWLAFSDSQLGSTTILDPIPMAVQRARTAVQSDLPNSIFFHNGELSREEVPRFRDRIIRELVVNAAMHRDYRAGGATQIIRYPNRIEFRNPGYSLASLDMIGEPVSRHRNPRIAAMLYDLGFAETKGAGVGIVRTLMKEMGLLPPVFLSDRVSHVFTAILLLRSVSEQETVSWLSNFRNFGYDNIDRMALFVARELRIVSARILMGVTQTNEELASISLRKITEHGFLMRTTTETGVIYKPTKMLLSVSASITKVANSPDNWSESVRSITDEGFDSVISKILAFCLNTWRTSDEIAIDLGRNAKHVKDYYLNELLRTERLEMDAKRNSPKVRYRTKEMQQ